ncbi:vacuolar protein-sorting protein bro1 [[Emmonsia] crescens]|uniref:BRO domain-containing protein 1 n=1 Tax=[Emmonsia] crescens TaxID=73230 RepID=A0A0G2J024_9EURO|nr:vacuolar protein-sorting protein bro1 [Emmonsia crescens UAMH 3008]
MVQSPMISSPLKQTSEIDWIQPLKAYIRQTYGDDPERYSEECATLNRLRQDMRGAGKDSAAGRDLLYRYYGQLELLDLRFPVDENHIKISFTWYDAFTHKPTSQYSLAYEKASIIFNISAVLSCHAANQSRSEDTGLKTAYHSFQASAGMFTYINENFLHAPSTDLSRDTVKTLISIMLAQGQEVFLEKQTADGKKPGFLAKLASQAAYLYSQATEGVQENVAKGIFEKVWSIVVQVKASLLAAIAGYYQAIADDEGTLYGISIARLQLAEKQATAALSWAKSFPSSPPAGSNLSTDTGPILVDIARRHLTNIQEKLATFTKDNDFIYHQPVPSEPSLSTIAKLPAAKAIPVSELYQGQDIQRIIGPDIFQKIVPMSVTESASLYDEEKAKLVRAEAEKVEAANGEMAASLDYLKLPGSLNILKGGMDQEMDVDEDFKMWCEELANAPPLRESFSELQEDKISILSVLDQCSKQLDMEESVCEKMRSKYGADWVQQPSSRLTSTLRSDVRTYRDTIDEASSSDSQLLVNLRQHEADFEEMRSAGETEETDVLFQRALIKAGGKHGKSRNGHGSPYSAAPETNLLGDDFQGETSVAEQISRVEELLRKLSLVKRDRNQILKDLKEKVHNDDISNVLILNKKSIANQENQLFQTELEKFRPHQNRLLQANHKQTALMKELTKVYGDLLQDNRVRSEQSKYEVLTRQRNSVMSKYKKIYNAFRDIRSGLEQAQAFYAEMKDSVDSLRKNVDTFVNNRRSEGAQLLSQIERDKAHHQSNQEEREREKLKNMMERLSVETSPQSPPTSSSSKPRPSPLQTNSGRSPLITSHHNAPAYPASGIAPQTSQYMVGQGQQQQQQQQQPQQPQQQQYTQQGPPGGPSAEGYNPMAYLYQPPISPQPNQQYFSPSQYGYASPQQPHSGMQPSHASQFMPQGYIPPPPPPRPSQSPHPQSNAQYPPTAYTQQQRYSAMLQQRPYSAVQLPHPSQTPQGPPGGQNNTNDPWAGLNVWK